MLKMHPETQIQISNEIIARILKEYDIFTFSTEPIHQGIQNTSLIIISDNKKYVLRIYSQTALSDKISLEVTFQDYLKSHGVPVPTIYPNTKGNKITAVSVDGKDWQCLLMEFISGNSVTEHPSDILIGALARMQAKMHILGTQYSHGSAHQKKEELHIETKEVPTLLPIDDEKITAFVGRATRHRYIFNKDLLYGYNHLDVDFDGNVLTEGDDIAGIIDFDDLAYSPAVLCLGYSLWNLLDDEGIDAARLYLKSYEEVRPLTQLEHEALPHAMIFRNYMIGLVRLKLWEKSTPIEDILKLLDLETEIPKLDLFVR
jgi:Ser/Thr protein kinase RdoA (MazF antagonist)